MDTIKLYFPSVDQDNKPLNQLIANKIYKDIIRDFSQLSGGCTVYPVSGYYVNAAGQLIQDDISLITCYTHHLDKMVEFIIIHGLLSFHLSTSWNTRYSVVHRYKWLL